MPASPQDRLLVDLADAESLDPASLPFVARWQRLISETNWEKGRIISQWRASYRAAGAAAAEYSDEAWSRMVTCVSGQHVGRLRRVFERFGDQYAGYPGLYWSHYCAALDWPDAEMWLEGAVHNAWSVAQMRRTRAETLGDMAAIERAGEPVPASEWDEDSRPASEGKSAARSAEEADAGVTEKGPTAAAADRDPPAGGERGVDKPAPRDAVSPEGEAAAEQAYVQPFEHLPELPDDLSEAFEQLKLAILHHKTEGWREVDPRDVLVALEALRELATAPA